MHDRCGDVVDVRTSTDGRNSDFAATLVLSFGERVFCKGVRVDGNAAAMCRVEARVGPYLPVRVPRLRWEIETAGWLVLGFDHVEGRRLDFSPGSADIPLVVDALTECAAVLTPSPARSLPSLGELFTRVEPWRRLRDDPPAFDPWTHANLTRFAGQEHAAAELASGCTLAHTDIHESNILIDRAARHAFSTGPGRSEARRTVGGHEPPGDPSRRGVTHPGTGGGPGEPQRDLARRTTRIRLRGGRPDLRRVGVPTTPGSRPFRDGPTRAARRWAMYRAGADEALARPTRRADPT